MVDIGINYLAGNDECYKILREHNIINTIKFPGRVCDYEHMEQCLNCASMLGFKVDLHGLPGMIPAFSCMEKDFVGNVDWNHLEQVLSNKELITRISTHIGLEHGDSFNNYTTEAVKDRWIQNYANLKNHMKKVIGKNIEIGLENIPGGFKYDEQSLTPEYVDENWNMADFGVFDITHAKLAAKTLEIDFDEYMARLKNLDEVKIFHISGNNDKTGIYEAKPDKHVLLSGEELDDIVKCRKLFKNLDLIVSEYSFESMYSIKKEIIIEAVVINFIATGVKPERIKNCLDYMKNELQDDINNIEEVFKNLDI